MIRSNVVKQPPHLENFCQSDCRTNSDVENTTVVPNSELESYVGAERAAAFLRIHPKTLMRLAREGKLPTYSFSEGTLLPTQPGEFSAPQARSHIQPHPDPLAREP
jgi:hypothetical protein